MFKSATLRALAGGMALCFAAIGSAQEVPKAVTDALAWADT